MNRIAAVVIATTALLSAGCESPTEPTPPPTPVVVNVYTNQINDSQNGGATPTPVGGQGCAPVASVGASARDSNFVVVGSGNQPGVLRVGETYSLDATPKDANGGILPTNCHAPVGEWTATPAGIVDLIGQVSSFNPQARARAAGDVTIRFTLGTGGPGTGMFVDLKLRVQ